MKKLIHYLQRYPLGFAVLTAAIIVVLTGLIFYSSNLGWPRELFQFDDTVEYTLPDDLDINGWAWFDGDSYLPGEIIHYNARILYRDNLIEPSLQQFERSVIFTPLEKRESKTAIKSLPGNIKEFTLTYELQGVEVEPHTRYRLDPVVLFYKRLDDPSGDLKSLRISTPDVYFTENYPSDVSTIPLKSLKSTLSQPFLLIHGVVVTFGILLLCISTYIFWHFGRKRKEPELSESEKLWNEFNQLKFEKPDKKELLSKSEAIVTKLLQDRIGMDPAEFWSGDYSENEYWNEFIAESRGIFNNIYTAGTIDEGISDRIITLLDRTFSEIVAEDRLRLEQQPSFLKRLVLQPKVLAAGTICFVLALLTFILSAMSQIWISPDLHKYNTLVANLSSDEPVLDESVPFEELSEETSNPLIKTASLYNAATINGLLKPSETPPMQEEELLEVVFQEDLSLEQYLDNDASVEMLFLSAGWLLRGKQLLQEAVRLDPYDQDIIQNLELITKRHDAVIAAINSLFEAMQRSDNMDVKTKMQTMVDVLNLEWPDEVEEKEEEEDSNPTYKVSERF